MTWTVDIENVAGIRRGGATVEPGLNVVRGTNWQGKSSFIAALATALGTERPLTEGQAEGGVTVETPDGTVRVDLEREGGTVVSRGEPLLTDAYDVDRAALFACLDEDNPVRAAVRRGENLEAVLTRPLEYEHLDERLAELTTDRGHVESALAGAEEAASRLPQLESRIADLESTIDGLREELPADEGDGEPGAEREALSAALAERNRERARVERLEASVERTAATLAERRGARDDVEVPDPDEPTPAPADAREELAALRRDVDLLQSVFSANRLVLETDRLSLVTDVTHAIAGETVTCWVCGSEVDREDIESHVAALGGQVSSVRAEVDRVAERVESLEAQLEGRRQAERRREALDAEIEDLVSTLEDRRESLAEARDRLEALEAEVASRSSAVQTSVEAVTAVESEIKYRETELEAAREELASLASRADRRGALRERLDELDAEVEALRNRKADLEDRARRAFDEAIADVLDRFDTGIETARLTSSFDLVVARAGREASLDALSEGELELIGFVAALAGHEAFEVGDRVPVILVDGTGSLADENRRRLVEYLADRATYLVFTAHPEDTAVAAHEIDPTAWTVVSDDVATAD